MRFNNLEFDQGNSHQENSEQSNTKGQFREPDHDDAYWLSSALAERRSGRHEPALRNYSRALELNRSLVAGWVGQVQMLIALGEYPEAELWSRKALELFKNNPDLLAGRGQALCRRSAFDEAAASCDAALAQPGMSAFPWVARGELMLARRHSTADYCFDKAVHFDPDWLNRLEIGEIHLHYAKPAKALSYMRQATEIAPDHAYCWYRKGQCEVALGQPAVARKSFETCLQLVPGHRDARRSIHEIDHHHRPVRNWLRRAFRWS